MADLVPYIYHEKQEPGSMMCLQHSINNLLQSELFSPASLADLARGLDDLEAEHLDPGTRLRGEVASQNVDESGFFSVQVAESAFKVLGLRLVRWGSQELASVHDKPEQIEAFLLNHQLHWFSIRRFAPSRFYNLDSCIAAPTWISPMYLGLQLREAELQGYSIFAVIPSSESHLASLPPCQANEIAPALGSPSGGQQTDRASPPAATSSRTGPFASSSTHTRFGPTGVSSTSSSSSSSASASASSNMSSHVAYPSFGRTWSSTSKGKRPASDEDRDLDDDDGDDDDGDDDDDDDDVIIEEPNGSTGGRGGGTSRSSVERESEKRKRRRKLDTGGGREPTGSMGNGQGSVGELETATNGQGAGYGDLSEEDMMARAIEESLRVSREGDEGGIRVGASKVSTSSKAAEHEEAEFQRALQASLAATQGGTNGGGGETDEHREEEEEEAEEDAPTMEELRRRRLARFA